MHKWERREKRSVKQQTYKFNKRNDADAQKAKKKISHHLDETLLYDTDVDDNDEEFVEFE